MQIASTMTALLQVHIILLSIVCLCNTRTIHWRQRWQQHTFGGDDTNAEDNSLHSMEHGQHLIGPGPMLSAESYARIGQQMEAMRSRLGQDMEAAEETLERLRMEVNKNRQMLPIRTLDPSTLDVPQYWTNCKQVLLGGRTNLFAVVRGEAVEGIPMAMLWENQGLFQLESYGSSLVRLKNIATNQFLVIDQFGMVGLQRELTVKSLLKVRQEENNFHTFASALYYIERPFDIFFSISKNGKPKPGRSTSSGDKSSQFLELQTENPKNCPRSNALWQD